MINVLYQDRFPVTDKISVMIPKVGDVLNHEEDYYALLSMLTSMPIDMMVQLDDIGVDFTTITDYDLFLILFNGIKDKDSSLIFGDLDLSKFELAQNTETDMMVVLDRENDIVIDRLVHAKITNVLRHIHGLKKDTRTPGNNAAKKYMIDRARVKQKRHAGKEHMSQLEPLIVSMVNTCEFKYDFEGTRELSIYQFNESVRQVMNKIDYDNRMIGVYSGCINAKELSQEDLTWLKTNK